MAEFFRKVVAQKKPGWRIVACGSRNGAHDAFRNANRTSPENFNVLLVDSEEAVAQARSPRNHLQQRDGWDLNGVNDDSIHLMIRVMETWIVADAGAVAEYYQQHFLKNALPIAANLEGVEKERIYKALEHATREDQERKVSQD
jgi:hypothetical protein